MKRVLLVLSGIILCSPGMALSAKEQGIDVTLGPPEFIIPRFATPFSTRESSIPPHEYELADSLRALLDEDNKQAAIDKLDTQFELDMSPALLHLKGQIYFALEDYQSAETTMRLVLARVPQLVRAHSDLGQLYLITERAEKARQHFSLAVKYGSKNPTVLGQLGYLNLTLHSPQSAVAAYQDALAMEPENPQWQQGLLSALSQSGQLDAARALLGRMLEQQPENAALWLNRSYLHLQKNDHFQALADLETAMALGESATENIHAAAQLHFQLGSFERGYELASRYVRSVPVSEELIEPMAHWLRQGKRWQALGELLDLYESQNDLNSAQLSRLYLQRARIHEGQQQWQAAGNFYKKALALDPAQTSVLLATADFYRARGRLLKAESLYSRAQALDSSQKRALLGKAQVYIELEDYQSALNTLHQAKELFPELHQLQENIALLESTLAAQHSRQ